MAIRCLLPTLTWLAGSEWDQVVVSVIVIVMLQPIISPVGSLYWANTVTHILYSHTIIHPIYSHTIIHPHLSCQQGCQILTGGTLPSSPCNTVTIILVYMGWGKPIINFCWVEVVLGLCWGFDNIRIHADYLNSEKLILPSPFLSTVSIISSTSWQVTLPGRCISTNFISSADMHPAVF